MKRTDDWVELKGIVSMYEHIWNGNEFTHRFYGTTSSEEVQLSIIRAQGDARFDAITEVIIDCTACESVTVRLDVVEEVAATDFAASKSNPNIRRAVITDNSEIINAVKSYLDSGLSPYPMRVFTSVADARKWFASTPKAVLGRVIAYMVGLAATRGDAICD